MPVGDSTTEEELLELANLDGCSDPIYNTAFSVAASSADNCRVTSAGIEGLSAGVCQVDLTVTQAIRSLVGGKYRVAPSKSTTVMTMVTGTGRGTSGGGGGGSSGGSGSGSSSASQAPLTSPVATQEPITTSVGSPGSAAESASSRNPASTQVVAPGMVLVSQTEASSAANRTLKNPPATTLSTAPKINATAGQPLSMLVSGQTPNARLDVKIKVNGTYVSLGNVNTDASGRVSLPVFKPTKPGRYAIAIVDPSTGKTTYIKVVIKPTKQV